MTDKKPATALRGTTPARIPGVESFPCPARKDDGKHVLVNTQAGRTRCDFCKEPWWKLDQLVRKGFYVEHAYGSR